MKDTGEQPDNGGTTGQNEPRASMFTLLPYIMLPMAMAASEQTIVSTALSAIAGALGSRFCGDLATPELREVGIARAGPQLFILVAAPLPLPSPRDRAQVESEVLRLVNEARAQPRRCGRVAYPAAPPLTLSPLLSRVANNHSTTMAARDDLGHDDPDGSTPADRVRRAGYAAGLVGENVASGVGTATEAVQGWLASPGHCSNIMDVRFTEMGVAYVAAQYRAAGIYWTQLFAKPRS